MQRFVLLALSLVLSSCGGSDVPRTIENTTFASGLGVDLAASTKTPHGEYIRDLAAGTGATLAAGQMVSAHYTGYLPDGTIFDSNVGHDPYSFQLGAGLVIAGWDEGLVGAKVGGVRQLVIPPELGYGPGGYPAAGIPPSAILVFAVQIDAAQ